MRIRPTWVLPSAREHQRVGDLAVGQAAGDQLGDLQLARGEAGELIGTWPVAARLAGELLDEPAGDGRRQQGLAGGDDADGRDQVVGGGVLEQEPAAPARSASYT